MRHVRRRLILAATDFSTAAGRALEWAVELAASRRAELRLVHATGWPQAGEETLELPDAVAAELVERARQLLAEVAAPLRPRVSRVSSVVEIGDPATVILQAAARCAPELVVVGARGLRGWRYPLLGSTATRVMERAPCPVLTVHPADAPPGKPPWRLLAATDFSADASQAAHAALRVFGRNVGELVLLHALASPRSERGSGPVLTSPTAQALYDSARVRSLAQLAVDAAPLLAERVAVRTELVEGLPPQAIVDAAEQLAADVLVMGSRGHGCLEHLLLGSNAERVARHARRPLLVLPRRAWLGADEESAEEEAPALAGAIGDAGA